MIGGTDVVQGAKIILVVGSRNGRNLEQIYKPSGSLTEFLIENGSKTRPEKITINGREGVEYDLEYEGPGYREVDFLASQEKYVSAYFTTEGDEVKHKDYPTFKKILESIKVK